jgi:hypothetical protein
VAPWWLFGRKGKGVLARIEFLKPHNQIQNQELVRGQLGESRRMALF